LGGEGAPDPPLMLMDEPFGAIDPITRERLQNDFLRLHREVRKTVIFVTHDIDEAIRMGDRIAILRQGGKLAQYDTPEAILADPADEFVADFVGADRGLKRLGLRTLAEIELLPEPAGGGNQRPEAALDMTLRDALSLMLTEGATELVVRERDGGVRGYLTLEGVSRLLGEGFGPNGHNGAGTREPQPERGEATG
jgi:osmoprotectant transport system ATP-binding protein